MPATIYNFSIEQGTSFAIQWKYIDAINSVPIDLANHCVVLRILPDNTSTPLTFTTTSSSTSTFASFTLKPDQGAISLFLPADTTNNFTWTQAKYELELILPEQFYTGSVRAIKRLVQGNIILIKRLIPATELPGCVASNINDQVQQEFFDMNTSYSVLDSCIGSPCEFIGGNANIYTLKHTDETTGMFFKDPNPTENLYGKSNPFYLSVNVSENKILERLDIMIEGLTHTCASDIRLLLTHNGSGVLLFSNDKFNYKNNPKNLSFILSNYTPDRPNGDKPSVLNVYDYYNSQLTNKNLGAAKISSLTTSVFPSGAFDGSDTNKNITVYASSLSVFEGMNVQGEWRVYGIDSYPENIGSLRSVKLISYFQNEQSDDESHSLFCGKIPRAATISGNSVSIIGDVSSEFENGDFIIINYDNGSGDVATMRSIVSSVIFNTNTDITSFTIDNTISGTVNNPYVVQYNSEL